MNPRCIRQYELQEQLGSRDGVEVWKAFDTHLQRFVVLKLLSAHLKEDSTFIARFEHEAQCIAALHHPNIVRVHDFRVAATNRDDAVAYMVMEYVDGQTLDRYLDATSRSGRIPYPLMIVPCFASICLAVQYAHQHGVIHRGLKPANILLDARNVVNNPVGEPILTDFGMKKLLRSGAETYTSAQLGSPFYLSPEQANGEPGTELSDIYALGVILYEMMTGRLPFQGNNPLMIMQQHRYAVPSAPRFINPNIPPHLEAVILYCLAKEPGARFINAHALATAVSHAFNMPVPERLVRTNPFTSPAAMSIHLTPEEKKIIPERYLQVDKNVLGDVSLSLPRITPDAAEIPPLVPEIHDRASSVAQPAPEPAHVSVATTAPPRLLPRPEVKKPQRRLITIFVVLVLCLIIGSRFLSLLFAPVNPLVGHAFFTSSGQLNDQAQGIADGVQIDLQHIEAPPAGKSYHVWLLGDQKGVPNNPLYVVPPPFLPDEPLLLASNVPVQNDAIHYTYHDPQNRNLFSVFSRLLITLDDAGTRMTDPSGDRTTWKYYAQFPQMFIPGDPTGLRGLDHLRHLYYQETATGEKGILARPGGLDIWTFRNVEKVMEFALSARDDFDGTTDTYQLMHDQFIRILDILDGAHNIGRDVPGGIMLVDADTVALTSLIPVPGQNLDTTADNPPGDLAHMQLHINELVKAPDASSDMRQRAQQIVTILNNLSNDSGNGWLQRVHADAKDLFDMTPVQLTQPNAQVLLEDLAAYATYAYVGRLDPKTDRVTPGILQVHDDIQQLAVFDVTTHVPVIL